MRVLALVSGGKDSTFAMVQAVAAGHDIVAMANLRPKDRNTSELDSFMFQTVGHEALSVLGEAMGGIPLFRGDLGGEGATPSQDTGPDYDPESDPGDEVEALHRLISTSRESVPFDAICSGAILSDYQRIRVENVCSRLGLVSLSYLWRRDQWELLNEMVDSGIQAVLVKVASLGLKPEHLGKSLGQMKDHLKNMEGKFGINVCGEGGEFETYTLDSPLFTKSIQITASNTVVHSDDAFAPVAFLRLKSVQLRDKQVPAFTDQRQLLSFNLGGSRRIRGPLDFLPSRCPDSGQESEKSPDEERPSDSVRFSQPSEDTSSVCFWQDKGWLFINNLTCTGSKDAKEPKTATEDVFKKLKDLLSSQSCSSSDLVAVTLLVPSMSDYAIINSEYVKNFGTNPPVRVCVQPSPYLLGPTLSAIGFKQSDIVGFDRKTMHVQSISHWAPANIGPYSQAVEVGDLVFVAGQIGLIPGSMQFPEATSHSAAVTMQAILSLRHVDRILKAKKASGGLRDLVQVLCFVTRLSDIPVVRGVWTKSLKSEDDEDDLQNGFSAPSPRYVVVPRLPKDALVEWQVLAVKRNERHEVMEVERDSDKADSEDENEVAVANRPERILRIQRIRRYSAPLRGTCEEEGGSERQRWTFLTAASVLTKDAEECKKDNHLISDYIKSILPRNYDSDTSPCCLIYLYHLGPPPSPEALLEARREFGRGQENRCSVVCVPVSALEARCDLIMAAWIIE